MTLKMSLGVWLRTLATAGTLIVAAAAEAQTVPLPNPILAPGAPWYFDSFIVDIPDEADWTSSFKTATSAELGRKYPDGHTASAIIEVRKLAKAVQAHDELLELVKRVQSAAPAAGTTLLEYSAEPVTPKGLLCARSLARFDDRRAQFEHAGVLVVRALNCVQPDRGQIVVGLRFVERSESGGGSMTPSEVGERFLRSLRFTPVSSDAIDRAREAIGRSQGADAVKALQPAAEQGDGEASLFLGNILLYGSGVPQDLQAARKWLELAASQGRIDALYNLGAIYDKGIGVPRDVAAAIKWFTLAADQRDPQAQLNLALFYLTGDGVDKSVETAELWFKRAANNGNRRAQRILAEGLYKRQ